MKKLIAWFTKYKVWMLAVFQPLGIWGVGLLAFIDSSSLPVPIDIIVALYAWQHKSHFLLYCLVAAVFSAVGSLVPYFIGRAGGELFLLKRVNRERYEALRDRFERQEFFAVMIPALMPPPTPIKLFEIAAGVFEMRTLSYVGAIFVGRLLRFSVDGLLTVLYGPQIVTVCMDVLVQHKWIVFGICIAVVVALWLYVRQRMRKKPAPAAPVE